MIDSIHAEVEYRKAKESLLVMSFVSFLIGLILGLGSEWKGCILFTVFFGGGSLALFYNVYRKRKKELVEEKARFILLQLKGKRIVAEISSIETVIFKNGRYAPYEYQYYLCTYLDLETEKILVFKSDGIYNYLTRKKTGDICKVYYDQKNLKNYYVDANV